MLQTLGQFRSLYYLCDMKKIAIIGGGAAGCFCAVEIKRRRPSCDVTVFEAASRPMIKLGLTGGGRCNITNSFEGVESLADVYPRGVNLMKRLLHSFGPSDCLHWFGEYGVRFVTQEDGCVFPESQDAMQIVHVLERAMRELRVNLVCNKKIANISELSGYDVVVVTTGGGTARLLEGTGIELVPDVPSLFTLKIADDGLRSLMGTVIDNVTLGLAGTRFRSSGTLLLTDWGVSGPATLRLSSYAARWLAAEQYRGTLIVNWLNDSEQGIRERLATMSEGSRTVANSHPSELTDRLWHMLVERAGIRPDARWAELGNKGLSRLVNILMSDSYPIIGRARFKEEFVTCGGVSLSEIDPSSMECRRLPGLYFAGEVLDIDAVTGGFNLQAAWSTAFTAAKSIASL